MTCDINNRSITVEAIDATPTTPLSWVIKYWGDISWQNGGFAETDIMDENGDFVLDAPPMKGAAAVSTITLNNIRLRDKGQDATNIQTMDMVNRTGKWADIVSTTDGAGNCESGEKTLTLKVTVTVDGTAVTYWWHRVTIAPASVAISPEGALTSITFTSRQPYPADAQES